jgi:hypothetical protein
MPPRALRKKRTGQRKPPRRSARARRPARAPLLIIECDAIKLASQGLHLGTAFTTLLDKFLGQEVVLIRTSSEARLREELAGAVHSHGRFRSIVIVGHSNETHLALTSDQHYAWKAVGRWLEIFEPEFLFLVACKAGRSPGVREVFGTVRTLRHIYASPVTLYKTQVSPLALLILQVLFSGKINHEMSQVLRLAQYGLTGGQIFHWRRSETGPGQEFNALAWDALATGMDHGPWDLAEEITKLLRHHLRK